MALLLAATVLADRPNIVLIISDDQAYRDFGFMGNTQVNTPHLDRLAKQSAFFPNGYVPSSVCSPSLATLLTGRYPHQHGQHPIVLIPEELPFKFNASFYIYGWTFPDRLQRPP